MWPLITSHLHLYNVIVSIHVNFHKNQYMNECSRENLANIPHIFLWDIESFWVEFNVKIIKVVGI